MSIVLGIYGCVALFLDGFLLGAQASECKVNIGGIFAAAFFAMIWPVTIPIYIFREVKDALEEKGYENEE